MNTLRQVPRIGCVQWLSKVRRLLEAGRMHPLLPSIRHTRTEKS